MLRWRVGAWGYWKSSSEKSRASDSLVTRLADEYVNNPKLAAEQISPRKKVLRHQRYTERYYSIAFIIAPIFKDHIA